MATVDYDKLSAKDKAKLAKEFSDKFHRAFIGKGTRENLAAQIVKQLRQIGSSELINKVSDTFYNDHGNKEAYRSRANDYQHNLRQAISREFSGGNETKMHRALGFAPDYIGDTTFGRKNPEKDLLASEGLDEQKSNLDLINSDDVPYIGESVKLGSGTPTPIKKFIKDTVESKKQPESAPAPESTPAPTKGLPQSVLNTMYGGKPPYQEGEENPFTGTKKAEDPQVGPTRALAETVESEAPQRGSRAFRKQSAEERKAQIGADDEKAKEMSSAIPNIIRSQLKLPRTRGTKEASTATPSGGGTSGGSGSGLGYLRSREDMMARDKAAKEAMGKEALERRRTGEQRFATLRPEILAQQAERARLAEEKRQANEIKSGSGELLGRVIRDKSGKIIGTSTTKAGRRALGSGYKGATGTFDFSKPAGSFAELDERDAVKGRMASRQQQVLDLMSGGPTEAQEKQIRPFDTGLAVNPDKIGTPTPSKTSPLSPIPTNKGVSGTPSIDASESVLSPEPFSMKAPPVTPTAMQLGLTKKEEPSTTDRLMQGDAERYQRDRRIQANQFMDARGDAKQQVIDTARLRDTATGGANYSGSNVTTGVEPAPSDKNRAAAFDKATNPTAEQIKKRLKQLQANQ